MSLLNRKDRRKMSLKDLEEARQRTENELASILLCVWLNVLFDEGESEERLQDLIKKVVDEYDRIEDFDKYKKETWDKTGITLIRTE